MTGRPQDEIPMEAREEACHLEKESLVFKAPLSKSFKKIEKGNSYKHIVDNPVDNPVDNWQPRLFADIPQMISISLGRLNNNLFANSLWKKVIQAFTRSSLHRLVPNHTLQDLCSANEVFSKELYKKIHNAIHDFKANVIKTEDNLYGYLYTVTTNFFEDTKKEMERIEVLYTPQMPFYDWLTTNEY